jgi:hypothetical protein
MRSRYPDFSHDSSCTPNYGLKIEGYLAKTREFAFSDWEAGIISTVGYIVDIVRLVVGIIRGRFGGMAGLRGVFAGIYSELLPYELRKTLASTT